MKKNFLDELEENLYESSGQQKPVEHPAMKSDPKKALNFLANIESALEGKAPLKGEANMLKEVFKKESTKTQPIQKVEQQYEPIEQEKDDLYDKKLAELYAQRLKKQNNTNQITEQNTNLNPNMLLETIKKDKDFSKKMLNVLLVENMDYFELVIKTINDKLIKDYEKLLKEHNAMKKILISLKKGQ